jgi:ribonuclease P protein component
VQRRHRLSRSRDFDAVYRQGRSVSTRFLVLYWFARPENGDGLEPRLGIAVPRQLGGAVVRNRIKRQLRESWRALLERVPAGNDYVLIARPGLPEAAEARGFDWLRERVDEVLQKANQ